MLLVCAVLFGLIVGALLKWREKLFFPMMAFGVCFSLQLLLVVLMRFGWFRPRLLRIMCGVNASAALVACATVSGAPFSFVWSVAPTPFFSLMVLAIVGINYAWIYFFVVLTISLILPRDILDLDFLSQVLLVVLKYDPIRCNKTKKKVTRLVPVSTCAVSLLVLSHTVRDSALRRKMSEKVFERLSLQKDMFVANLSHEVFIFASFVCTFFLFVFLFFDQIRTPLHGLVGSAEMLKSDRHLSSAASENVDAILHCSSALRLLIENVLAVGKEGGLVRTEVKKKKKKNSFVCFDLGFKTTG
jgi:signal transduction histidine kinase